MRPVGRAAGVVSLPNIAAGAVAPEIAAEISSLQSSVSSLQSKLSLSDVSSDVTQLDQQLSKLATTLENVRNQGYKYSGDMDSKLYDVISQWQSLKPQVEQAIGQQASVLTQSAAGLQGTLSQLAARAGNAAQARSLLPSASSTVNSLLGNASQAESTIEAMYANVKSDASAVTGRLSRIETMMALLSGAKFKMADGESGIMAVKAKLDKEGKDDPEGYLFLTDKRLVFEQNQEIVTKKVLFVATEKEKLHEVLVETQLSDIGIAKASKKGLMGHEDHLDVDYGGQSAHFHIDGQDSNEWQVMIERARAGGFESERAKAGAGMSIADLTGPVTQADILQAQSQVNDLQTRAMLSFAKDALEDLETKVGNLPRQSSDARAKGYLFEKALESQVQSLIDQWAGVKQAVSGDMSQQSAMLGQMMVGLQQQTAQLMGQSANPQAARPMYMQVKSLAASAEAQAAAAEQSILGQYDNFQAEADKLSAHFDWIAWMLEALSTASFQLMATEGGVAAAQANWLRPNSDPLGGIVFLTDQRFIFEEREGEFSVPVDVPLAQVEGAVGLSEQGANKDEEHLSMDFASGAPMRTALFQLVGPQAEDWQAMIGRAKNGDYTKDRAVEIDQAEVDRVKNAPTQCPSCGSAFTKPVLRGQTEIKCDACGTVTRI